MPQYRKRRSKKRKKMTRRRAKMSRVLMTSILRREMPRRRRGSLMRSSSLRGVRRRILWRGSWELGRTNWLKGLRLCWSRKLAICLLDLLLLMSRNTSTLNLLKISKFSSKKNTLLYYKGFLMDLRFFTK